MNTPHQFTQYYKTISNIELLAILDNTSDYQPLAVEAAKLEYDNRQLSDSDIQDARQVLANKQKEKDRQLEKIRTVENKIRTTGYSFIETINPIQSGMPSTEKTIRFISVVFAVIFLYQFVTDFGSYIIYIKDIPRFPFESLIFLLPQILLLIAVITFWKRITFGWILLTAFVSLSAFATTMILYQSLTWKPSGFGGLENIFPRPSPITYASQTLFLLGTIYVLCKSNIRNVYSINNQKMASTILISIFVSFMLMILLS